MGDGKIREAREVSGIRGHDVKFPPPQKKINKEIMLKQKERCVKGWP